MKFEDLFNFDNPFETKSKKPEPEKTTFADVAGVDEAKQELQEVVDFLKNPERFSEIGAKIPKGVLLAGPPGTGKTLLARAVAGEAGVPFHSASGSEFVELYVGRGAARVRDLFKEARRDAPSIVFIDEIDAVGKQRSAGGPNTNDEREQTLNQLLTEMNGFAEDTGVIVLGATNRIDTLDDALLRPGRFDRKVTVGLPDRAGREKILEVHARKVALADDVDLKQIAKRTPGFAGADLANLLNEAAILAVRNGRNSVTMADMSAAIDRILAGPEKIDSYISEERKRLVAYHEAGHAIVGHYSPEFDNIEKITIVPRGQAGGLTWFTPNEKVLDSGLATYQYLKSQIATALGGRIAEELAFGKEAVTTGASNDLQKVTQIARQMVERYGMSSIGPLSLESPNSAFNRGYSEDLAKEIDFEVRALVKEAYDDALSILSKNIDKLDKVSEALVQKETIDGQEFRDMLDPPSAKELAARKLTAIEEQSGKVTGEENASPISDNDSRPQAPSGSDALSRWSDMEINPHTRLHPNAKPGFKRS
jgi:cell division protease FtsH